MIRFQGVEDLKALFLNLSVQRLTWCFMHREAPTVARLLGVPNIQQYRGEKAKIAAMKAAVMAGAVADEAPKCPCDAAPTGLRWMRADFDGSDPIKLFIADDVPQRFMPAIQRSWQMLSDETARLNFQYVDREEDAEIITRYQPYDGPGRTLGVTIYYTQEGSDDLDVNIPVELIIDSDEPMWADEATFDSFAEDEFETVYIHEDKHAVGENHTPETEIQGENILDAYYHGPQLDYGPWDRSESTSRYGVPHA